MRGSRPEPSKFPDIFYTDQSISRIKAPTEISSSILDQCTPRPLPIKRHSCLELSEYCREKGLYPEQLKEWRAAFLDNGVQKAKSNQQVNTQNKADKRRISQLEKELRRKEKALAESAALLILRKKLDFL